MKRTDFRFLERLRVRWAEIDQQKIVFNGHYLMYFDTAITGYWRALALPYAQTLEHLGGDLFVRKATLEYDGSARLDDLLDVGIRCARVGNSSMTFDAACSAPRSCSSRRARLRVRRSGDADVASRCRSAARGAAGLRGRQADGRRARRLVGALGGDAQAIRTAVFFDEQKIPAEMEWDTAGQRRVVHAWHTTDSACPLAIRPPARARAASPRSAAWPSWQTRRGSRIGRSVLDALMQPHAAIAKCAANAQLSAAPF
jgi:YbgC/YbaW family acyl-CoA thioester hydrolase